jgi:hypothetical protein
MRLFCFFKWRFHAKVWSAYVLTAAVSRFHDCSSFPCLAQLGPAPAMTAIARVFARVFPASSLQANVLKQVALFVGAVLFVSLLSMTYGLDLSAGFF